MSPSEGSDGAVAPELAERLNSLLKKDSFPPFPRGWRVSPFVISWHSKVSRCFAELKTCNLAGFREICFRLKDELEGDYAEIVREQDGQKFTSFESFLVIIQFESYLLHKTPCSYCHSAQVECEPRKASGNGKAKCTQCVNRKTKCSLASIPRQIFNIQFVTDPGSNAMPTTSTEPDEEMGESPTGTTNPSGTTTPEADSSDGLEEALRALDLMICETEEELSKVFGSITTKMADVLYATPIKRFPLGSSH